MAFSKGSVQSPAVLKKSDGAGRVGYGAETVAQRFTRLEPDYVAASSNSQTGSYGGAPADITAKLRKNRYLKHGIFMTPDTALGHRMGRLTYRTGSNPAILNDLANFFPKGFDLKPGIAEQVGLTVRYVAPYGAPTNGGTSFADAYDRITDAVADSPDVIYLEPFHYDISTSSLGEITLTKDLCMIAVGGQAIISSRRQATWTDNGDGTYTSSTLGGTPIQVFDRRVKTANGSYKKFARKTTGPEVIAETHSWWISGGSGSSQVVTVNTGGLVPENYYTWVQRSVNRNINFNAADHKFYCENIRWIAGDNSGLTPYNGTDNAVFAAKNCTFENSHVNDGLRVQGVGVSISIDCTARNNEKDGFNYHQGTNDLTDTIQVHFLEINCIGFDQSETAGTGNGSTAHDTCIGIRLNCSYGFNVGPGIVDINNSKTYNINCTSNNNYGDPNATGVRGDNNAVIWLHGGAFGLNRSQDILATATAKIYQCDTECGSLSFDTSDQIEEFVPATS